MIIRNLILQVIFLFILSYQKTQAQECRSYKVINIDSTKSYYLILVKNEDVKSLIISSKRRVKSNQKIAISKSYYLKLSKSKLLKDLPHNFEEIPTKLMFEGKLIWTNKDDFSVYSTKNLKGLNYVKKCHCPF
ncbi:hypothetical protein [Flavobacterium aurantiibacter]|uniref:Uncharacterized protein n=1 Tax=Flavobacterium aurantiibacter TaxID=2023067 RepID=A0A256A7S2_9FLAO|nr:hypothetical protein [Flavobacterium aurantiibacter]OYQ49649.1 hypothetical protein CHX27_01335 [Flavobacterium aurantiibacter]